MKSFFLQKNAPTFYHSYIYYKSYILIPFKNHTIGVAHIHINTVTYKCDMKILNRLPLPHMAVFQNHP